MPKKVLIAGAGLVGPMLAIAMSKEGHQVTLFEARSDRRKISQDAGKSINLIITAKGLKTVEEAGILKEVKAITTPVYGRMMHSKTGELTFQAYGKDESEFNYSISRAKLNMLLMTLAEREGVQIYFDEPLEAIDFENRQASFSTHKNCQYDLFFGTDGAGSVTRKELVRIHAGAMENRVEPLGIDYKELFMPAGEQYSYQIDQKSLHIWPRGNHMLMALPNSDGSFTMTLYMPSVEFEKLDSSEKLKNYFETEYPDALPLMPDYQLDFEKNPQGFLGTVRCNPWVYQDSVALGGDAAHAVVPFFGQGMNCGFEDITYLTKMMKCHSDWATILEEYNQHQKLSDDAIADMAIENWNVMSSSVADKNYLLRKSVEKILENEFPKKYKSRYGMVVYTLIPYHFAQRVGLLQKEILETLCSNLLNAEEVDLKQASVLIDQKLVPYYREHNLSLDNFMP